MVNLGQGFPDFSPPDFAVQAFQRATSENFMLNQYTMAFVSLLPLLKVLGNGQQCSVSVKTHGTEPSLASLSY